MTGWAKPSAHRGRELQRERAHERDVELVAWRDAGVTIRGIADALGVTERSASTIVWRARRRLKQS